MSAQKVHVNTHKRNINFARLAKQSGEPASYLKELAAKTGAKTETEVATAAYDEFFGAPGTQSRIHHEKELEEEFGSGRDPTLPIEHNVAQTQQEALHGTWKVLPNVGKKTRPQDKPYRVYTNDAGWEWRVLKSYQNDEDAPNARWFLAVKSPLTGGTFELGDGYVSEVKGQGRLTKVNP